MHYNPKRATWILHRLEDVRAALRDTDQVTSTEGRTRIKFTAPAAQPAFMVLTDGEQHTDLRKQVQPAFTKGALDSWREMIDKLAVELVNEVLMRTEIIRTGTSVSTDDVDAAFGRFATNNKMTQAQLSMVLDKAGIGVAHFNHQLRATADGDEQHAISIAGALGVPAIADREDVAARARAERR